MRDKVMVRLKSKTTPHCPFCGSGMELTMEGVNKLDDSRIKSWDCIDCDTSVTKEEYDE